MCIGLLGSYLYISPSFPNIGKTTYVSLAGFGEKCVAVSIEKTLSGGQGTVTSVEFDGVPQGLSYLSLNMVNPLANYIGCAGGATSWLFDSFVWNFNIYDISGAPSLMHTWVGYPHGNTNPAWVDAVSANNGTVAGTPNVYNC